MHSLHVQTSIQSTKQVGPYTNNLIHGARLLECITYAYGQWPIRSTFKTASLQGIRGSRPGSIVSEGCKQLKKASTRSVDDLKSLHVMIGSLKLPCNGTANPNAADASSWERKLCTGSNGKMLPDDLSEQNHVRTYSSRRFASVSASALGNHMIGGRFCDSLHTKPFLLQTIVQLNSSWHGTSLFQRRNCTWQQMLLANFADK